MQLAVVFPFLNWITKVDRATFRADFIAGLTGAIVVMPQGVAFATIAGMPPQYGLYAAIVPTVIAALFGSSWHLVAGPSTTASLILFASLAVFAEPGSVHYVELALTLAFMVGLLEFTLGIFKLGMIVNFISHSVVVGYTAGVGILIIATQTRNFFGLKIPRSPEFISTITSAIKHLNGISWSTTLVAVATLFTGILIRKYLPRVPYMIVAILIGGFCAAAVDYWHPDAVSTIGALPSRLPPLSAPSFDPQIWIMLIPTALAVAISALNEVVSIGRALAIRSEQHLNINQEFIGQGLANSLGCFFSGYVVSGSFNRSALNYYTGARTPMSALIASVLLAVLLVTAAPLAAYLPHAAMAASLVLVGWSLIDRKSIVRIVKTSKSESAVLAVTIFSALFIQVQMAILIGVALSLMIYLYRTSNPHLRPRVPDPFGSARKFTDPSDELPECRQFHMMRLDGSLFFGAVSRFRDALRDAEANAPDCKHIAIFMDGVNFVDVAGAELLAIEAKRLRKRGGGLYLVGPKERVLDLLQRGRYIDDIGAANIFKSKTEAIRTVYRKLDYDICRQCKLRVFVECVRMGKQEPLEADEPLDEAELAAKSQDDQRAAGDGA